MLGEAMQVAHTLLDSLLAAAALGAAPFALRERTWGAFAVMAHIG